MTEDDIIPSRTDVLRMAREAGLFVHKEVQPEIERFFQAAYAAGASAAKAKEREACAKECDELAGILFCHGDKEGAELAVSLRDTIRARGQT